MFLAAFTALTSPAPAGTAYYRHGTEGTIPAKGGGPSAGGDGTTDNSMSLAFAGPEAGVADSSAAGRRFTAKNAVPPVTYTATGLPGGVTLTDDGVLTGTFREVGTFTATVVAKDANGITATSLVELRVNAPGQPPSFSVSGSGPDVAGVPFAAHSVVNSGNISDWALATGHPTFLGIDGAGAVTGTPPLGLTGFTFGVIGADGWKRSDQVDRTVTLEQPALTIAGLASGYLPGDVVAATIATNLPGASLSAPGRPAWLALSPDGNLTGTVPATSGDLPFPATATHANGVSASQSVPLSVSPVTVSLSGLQAGAQGFDTVSGTVAASLGSGWTYAVDGRPPWLDLAPDTGVLSGTADNVGGTLTLSPSATRNGITVPGQQRTLTVTAATLAVTGQPAVAVKGMAMTGRATGADDGTYALTGNPSWLSVSHDGRLLGTVGAPGGPFDVAVSGRRNGGTLALARFPLTVQEASASAAGISSAGVVEGGSFSGALTSNIPGATWAKLSGPSWVSVSSDGTVSGVIPDHPGYPGVVTYTLSARARGPDGTQADASKTLTVTLGYANFLGGAYRSGTTYSGALTTTIPGPGRWTVDSAPQGGTATIADPTSPSAILSGRAPANTGTSPVAYTVRATYTSSSTPSTGAPAAGIISASANNMLVYPTLTVSQVDQSAGVGTAMPQSFPQVTGLAGTARYALMSGSTDLSDAIGATCPGLLFNKDYGHLYGTPGGPCSMAGLTVTLTDSGHSWPETLRQTVASGPFALVVTHPLAMTTQPGSFPVVQGTSATGTAATLSRQPYGPVTWQIVAANGTVPSWFSLNGCGNTSTTCSVTASPDASVGTGVYPSSGALRLRAYDSQGEVYSNGFTVTINPAPATAANTCYTETVSSNVYYYSFSKPVISNGMRWYDTHTSFPGTTSAQFQASTTDRVGNNSGSAYILYSYSLPPSGAKTETGLMSGREVTASIFFLGVAEFHNGGGTHSYRGIPTYNGSTKGRC